MAYTAIIQQQQRKNLLNILRSAKYADTVIIVGKTKTEFKVNRVFLASISKKFEQLLFDNVEQRIEIDYIDANAFNSILQFAYCNNPGLNSTNIISIKQFCDQYDIKALSKLCDSYFESFLTAHNICSMLDQSMKAELTIYTQRCLHAIQHKLGEKASIIFHCNGFNQMGTASMKLLLRSDYLNIKEEQIWEAVYQWAQNQACHQNGNQDFKVSLPPKKKMKLIRNNANIYNNNNSNNSNNKQYEDEDDDVECVDDVILLLHELKYYIRWSLMDIKYFIKKVKPLNILSNKDVADILVYHQCKDEGCGDFTTRPRAYIPISISPKINTNIIKNIQTPQALSQPVFVSHERHKQQPKTPKIALLPYELVVRMHCALIEPIDNVYDALINTNLSHGIVTIPSQRNKNKLLNTIKASFGRKVCITKMKLAPYVSPDGKWGYQYLNGCNISYASDEEEIGGWKNIATEYCVSKNGILSLNLGYPHTESIVIWTSENRKLGIGHLSFYGFECKK